LTGSDRQQETKSTNLLVDTNIKTCPMDELLRARF